MRVARSLLINSILATTVTCGTHAALAEDVIPDHPLLSDSLHISLSGFYSRNATTAALGPSGGGTGVSVDFEETLDLSDREATPMLGVVWRATERWRMEVEYFELKRDATRRLSGDLEWGDETYTAGSDVDSTFNVSDTRISAGYSFFRTRDKELGAGVGLHISKLEASLGTTNIATEGSDVTAPLPVINLYGAFALTDTWAIRLRTDWLSLTYGDYSGDIRDMSIDVNYQPWRHMGLGFGVRNLVMDLDVDANDWHGQARVNFQGPTAFVSASF